MAGLEGLEDKYAEFWARADRGFDLTQDEQAQVDAAIRTSQKPGLGSVALALGAGFLIYRQFMSTRLKSELAQTGAEPAVIKMVAAALYRSFLPAWTAIAVPALIKGYRIGMHEADAGVVPDTYLYDIADNYAKELGTHINDVSMEAMMNGYHAQVNRKIPAARAAQMVAQVYGVPPRTMNTLVSVWNTEDLKRLSTLPQDVARDTRAKALAEKEILRRSHQIGGTESWTAKSQAKQIVWMYGMKNGIIPEYAQRTWITAADEKVCKHCGPLHELSAPVGVQFKTGIGKVWSPPLHVNCRCDVILDVDITPDMDAELRRMVESQPVSKARGDDEYDRDKNGRFSRKEERGPQRQRAAQPSRPHVRPFKEPEVDRITVASLWEQADTPEKEAIVRDVIEEARERARLRAAARREDHAAEPSKITPIERTPLRTPLRTPTEIARTTPIQQPGETIPAPEVVRERIKAKKTAIPRTPIQREKIKPEVSPVTADLLRRMKLDIPEVEDEKGNVWEQLPRPMFVFKRPYESSPEGTFLVGQDEALFLADDENSIDKLGEKIREHWEDVKSDIMKDVGFEHDEDTDIQVYIDDDEGEEWDMDRESVEEVIDYLISNQPPDDAPMIWLTRWDEEGEQSIEKGISAEQAANSLEIRMPDYMAGRRRNAGWMPRRTSDYMVPLRQYIDMERPDIFMINHGFEGSTQLELPTKHGEGVYRNPGKWVIEDYNVETIPELDDRMEHIKGLEAAPYNIRSAKPIDVD